MLANLPTCPGSLLPLAEMAQTFVLSILGQYSFWPLSNGKKKGGYNWPRPPIYASLIRLTTWVFN